MARSAFVAMAYEDREGRHEIGEGVVFADETPQQCAAFERLVAFGIISLEPPAPQPAPEPQPEPSESPAPTQQRRPRRRS